MFKAKDELGIFPIMHMLPLTNRGGGLGATSGFSKILGAITIGTGLIVMGFVMFSVVPQAVLSEALLT